MLYVNTKTTKHMFAALVIGVARIARQERHEWYSRKKREKGGSRDKGRPW